MSWALMCPVHIYYPSLTDWSFTFSISMTSCIVWILIMGFTYMHVIVYRHIRIRPVTGNIAWKLSNVSVLYSNKKYCHTIHIKYKAYYLQWKSDIIIRRQYLPLKRYRMLPNFRELQYSRPWSSEHLRATSMSDKQICSDNWIKW